MPKTVYLANHYGFSAQQRELLLPPIVAALESLGLEVWEPFARNNQVDFCPAPAGPTRWARPTSATWPTPTPSSPWSTACPPDEGVMVELGMAIALGKPTFLFRDDFPPRHRQRGVPPEPDALHRHPRTGLAGLLLHLRRRNNRPPKGPRPMGKSPFPLDGGGFRLRRPVTGRSEPALSLPKGWE